ncbi:hypothetical protein MX107_000701 [Escherichia coli]|nr:hypothetical protein [Escherichia coli]
MNETELKHVIALLLEDAKRLQQLEPNAGTEARIWIAKRAIQKSDLTTINTASPDTSVCFINEVFLSFKNGL